MSRGAAPSLLILACTGFFAMTLNWFDMSAGFPTLSHHFHLSVRGFSFIIAAFLIGYGVFHIPSGMWLRRYGIRRIVLVGLIGESLMAVLSGFPPSVPVIWVLRFFAGGGAAMVAGAELTLVTTLFHPNHLARAQGLAAGAAYGLGALTGLWLWSPLVQHWGMANAFMLAGAIGLGVASLHWIALPKELPHTPHHDSYVALKRVLRQKNLWWIGLGSMGGYGAYFTVSQIGAATIASTFHVHSSTALYGGVMLATGVVGALIGGYLSDRHHTRKWLILGPGLAIGIWIIIFPHLSAAFVLPGFMVTGFLSMLPRPAYAAVPGDDIRYIPLHDVATAEGLIFTFLAIGGALLPILFGATSWAFGDSVGWNVLGIAVLLCTLFAWPIQDAWASTRNPSVSSNSTESSLSPLPHD